MTCDISSCEVTYPYFIGECGSNSCNSLPCKYGGTCQMKGSDVYSCVCKKGFTGKCRDASQKSITGDACFFEPLDRAQSKKNFEPSFVKIGWRVQKLWASEIAYFWSIIFQRWPPSIMVLMTVLEFWFSV